MSRTLEALNEVDARFTAARAGHGTRKPVDEAVDAFAMLAHGTFMGAEPEESLEAIRAAAEGLFARAAADGLDAGALAFGTLAYGMVAGAVGSDEDPRVEPLARALRAIRDSSPHAREAGIARRALREAGLEP